MRIGGSSGGGGGRFERPSAGERLFEGRMPNPVDVADGGDAEKIAEIQLGGPRILVGATAPDGSASAVVREDGLLEVRDAATWSPVATLSLVQKDAPLDPEGVVLAFSRDSSRLAFGMGRLVTTFWISRRTSTASRA